MRDEKFGVRMSKDVLLRKPLRKHQVLWLVLHGLRLPLPDDSLLQLAEHINQSFPL